MHAIPQLSFPEVPLIHAVQRHVKTILLLAFTSLAPLISHADTTVDFRYEGSGGYSGAEDTYISGQFPEASLGGLTGAYIGRPSGYITKGLFRFDISSLQGSFTSITGVKLKLKIIQKSGTWSSQSFNLYRIADANKAWKPGTGTGGSVLQDGSACWAHQIYSSILDLSGNPTHTPWAGSAGLSTATTDYYPTPVGSAVINSTDPDGSVITFNFTDVSYLADWVNNPSHNAGFILRCPGLETVLASVRFWTAEAPAAADRPVFSVTMSGYVPPPSWDINYNLTQAGRISIVISNSSGQIVRELLHAAQRPAGANVEHWDGRDESGALLPNGTYSWKLLSSQGIVATYQQTLGTDLPVKYDTWPGNHFPAAAVAVDSTGVYAVAGSSEGAPLMIKMDAAGNRIWTTSINWAEPWMGGWALSVDGGKIYMLQQNGKVKVFNSTTSPPASASATWNLLYDPADNVSSGSGQMGVMDICARGGKWIVSYKNHNAIRWIDPTTGAVIQEVTVPAPTGVALSPDGSTAYICSNDNSLVKLTYGATTTATIRTFTTGQVPYRLDWDAATGYLFVALRGTDNRVMKINPTNGGTNTTYGGLNSGVRQGGINQQHYAGVEDIAMAPDGSWWVTEPHMPPLRLAHYGTSSASPLKSFYGGYEYAAFAVADPADPTAVWVDSVRNQTLIKTVVDYTNKTWRPTHVYSYAHPLLPDLTYPAWKIIRRSGVTYFCRTPALTVYKLTAAGLVPCAFGGKAMDGGRTNWFIPADMRPTDGSKPYGFTWADLNDDGIAQQTEMSYDYSGNRVVKISAGSAAHIDGNLVQYGVFYTAANTGHGPGRIAPRSWTTGGAPVYNWADVTYPTSNVPASLNTCESTGFALDSSGNYYTSYNTNLNTPTGYGPWGSRSGGNKLVKWNSSGVFQWMVGRHSTTAGADPGQMRFVYWITGYVNDCALLSDVELSLVHIYDRDGLYVGRVLEFNGDGSPTEAYTLCGENFAGSVVKDANGNVYFYGGAVNRVHIYKLTGWDTISRQNGTVVKN